MSSSDKFREINFMKNTIVNELSRLEDVKIFFQQILNEGINFHPDTDFLDYINLQSNQPTYSVADANLRNKLLEESFEICENEDADIYSIGLELFLSHTGLNKYIPFEN